MKVDHKETFAEAIFSTLSHSFIRSFFSFAFLAFSILFVSSKDMGVYGTIISLVEIILYVVSFGLTNTLPKYLISEKYSTRKVILFSTLQSSIVTVLSLALVFLFYSLNLFPDNFYAFPKSFLFLTIFSTFGFSVATILRSYYFALRKENIGGLSKTLLIFFQYFFSIIFYLINKTPESLVLGYAAGNFLMLFISVCLFYKILNKKDNHSISEIKMLPMIRSNFDNMIFSLQTYLLIQLPILLAIFFNLDLEFIGNLKMSLMIINFFMIIPFSIEQTIVHRFHILWIKNEFYEIKKRLTKVLDNLNNLLNPLIISASLFFVIYFRFFSDNYPMAPKIILYYLLPFTLISVSRILYTSLVSIGEESFLILLMFLAIFANFVLNFILNKFIGDFSVVISMIIPYLLLLYFLQRKIKEKVKEMLFSDTNRKIFLWNLLGFFMIYLAQYLNLYMSILVLIISLFFSLFSFKDYLFLNLVKKYLFKSKEISQ